MRRCNSFGLCLLICGWILLLQWSIPCPAVSKSPPPCTFPPEDETPLSPYPLAPLGLDVTYTLPDAFGQPMALQLFPVSSEQPVPVRRYAYSSPGSTVIRGARKHPNAPGYSSLSVDTSGPNNIHFRNVCWHRGELYITRPPGSPLLLSEEVRKRMETVLNGFHPEFWGKLVERESTEPMRQHMRNDNPLWFEEADPVVLLRPAYSRHISHFTEALTSVVHMLRFPAVFPWVNQTRVLFMPTFARQGELGWNEAFFQVILSFFRQEPRVLRKEDIGGRTHCFERLVWVGCAGNIDWGNLYVDPYEAMLVRQRAYQLFNVTQTEYQEADRPRALVVHRKSGNAGRRMANAEDVNNHVRSAGTNMVFLENPWEGALERGSFAQQLQILAKTDVLIGVHGSGLNNAIFLQPGSVVIDILPGRMLQTVWYNTAVSLDCITFS